MIKILDVFSSFLRTDQISVDENIRKTMSEDSSECRHWDEMYGQAVLYPESTTDVVHIVKYCNEQSIKLVICGGRTGLSGGNIAGTNEVVISMERMNKLINIDLESGTITAQAGMTQGEAHQICEKHGMYFPVDYAIKDECQLGGNIATNAGGFRVIKYGMTRDNVIGLEVVTGDGKLLDLNRKLHKDNSGYDLKQLFVGSEGTLGIVTKATFKIVPPMQSPIAALLGVSSVKACTKLLAQARKAGFDIVGFEFWTRNCTERVMQHHPEIADPFDAAYPVYALIDVQNIDRERYEAFFHTITLDADIQIQDIRLSQDKADYEYLWSLRGCISRSLHHTIKHIHKNDISLPINQLGNFLNEFTPMLEQNYKSFELYLWGHIGDGNLHVNITDQGSFSADMFQTVTKVLDEYMFDLILRYEGSISAEHGIGLLKKPYLAKQKSPETLEYFRSLKQMFDPNNILNSGKVV